MTETKVRILMCRPTYYKVFYSINPWMDLNNPVDTNKATKQWEKLKDTIEKCGAKVEVMELDEDAKDLPDIVFTANAGIVRGKQVYLANFTHKQRKPEWKINDKWFKEHGFKTHFNPNISHEGTGDALWINKGKILLAGIGPRSDLCALTDIHKRLCTSGDDFKVLAVKLVDERFYHLDTCICPLDDNLALWYPNAFHPISQFNISNYLELLPVTESEAQQFACNAVVIGKDVIMNEGSERIAKVLQSRGFRAHFLPMSEYLKSGGSSKCLTLRLDYDWYKS
ncbi:hypothetical protein RB195_002163 [Necator americanus]|uniref:Amidinotransferase n=1 Tax=Necator americanus TaxID=51031 RepID=A0ABR1DJ44_NECAM